MTAIPIDARSLEEPPNGALVSFRTRNGYLVDGGRFAIMEGSREPTPLGWYLLRHMAAHDPPLKQAQLADAVGVSQSTISRWIYQPDIRPDDELLRKAANYLKAGPAELLALAGYYVEASNAPLPQPDPEIITKIRLILTSPALTPDKRAALESVLNAVTAPYDVYLPTRQRRVS